MRCFLDIMRIGVFGASLCYAPLAAASLSSSFYEEARDELILEVVKPPYRLSEAIIVFQIGNRHYLPLHALATLMDVSLESESARGTAHGWFISEDRIFSIDYDKHEWRDADGTHKLGANDLIIDAAAGEIYISLALLEKLWRPAQFSVNLSTLQLEISSATPLPFETRLEREAARMRALNMRESRNQPDTSGWPVVRNPYRFLSAPYLDLEAESVYRDNEARRHSARLNLHGRHDIGFMAADYTASFAHDRTNDITDPRRVRLLLERRAYGDDRMAFGARHIQGGDIRIGLPALIDSGAGGRGASISSNPIRQEGTFDRITVDGTGQPGWEVELYRNDELIAFTNIEPNGEYRFENVELNAGNNQMRIMQYGPQGQMKEDIRYYTIGAGMVRPGAFEYRLGALDRNRALLSPWIDMEEPAPTAQDGLTGHLYLARGITSALTGFASLTHTQDDQAVQGGQAGQDKHNNTASIGFIGNLFNVFTRLEAYHQQGTAQAIDARLATLWKKITLNMRASFFGDGFVSQEAGYGDQAKKFEFEARAATNSRQPFGMLGLQAGIRHMRDRMDMDSTTIDTRQSFSRGRLHLSHGTQTRLNDGRHEYTNALLGLNAHLYRNWQLRGQFQYDLYPDYRAQNALAELRYRSPHDFSAALRGQYFFDRDTTGFGGQIGYDFGSFLGSVDVDWLQHDGLAVYLRASTSLGPTGPSGQYRMQSTKLSTQSPFDAHIFLDQNEDGVWSEGDLPLPGAGLRSHFMAYNQQSSEDGHLRALAPQEGRTALSLDPGTLDDPYHHPATKGVLADLRPGAPLRLAFPVIETGAVDGTIYRADGRGASNIALILRNQAGEIIQTTHSAHDGYYNFDFVPRGQYQIATAPAYEFDPVARDVTLAGEEIFQFGFDLSLPEKTAP